MDNVRCPDAGSTQVLPASGTGTLYSSTFPMAPFAHWSGVSVDTTVAGIVPIDFYTAKGFAHIDDWKTDDFKDKSDSKSVVVL